MGAQAAAVIISLLSAEKAPVDSTMRHFSIGYAAMSFYALISSLRHESKS